MAGFMAGIAKKSINFAMISMVNGGAEGIRTLETVPRLHP
jgi:hypothetical protein